MSINFQGQCLPLPLVLMRCSHCNRGDLTWTGHAWRCTHTVQRTDGRVIRCRHGLSLEALFDVHDLEFRLHCGQSLSTLPLTGYALNMLRLGTITVPWLSQREAQRLYDRMPTEDAEDDHDTLARLITEKPQRRDQEMEFGVFVTNTATGEVRMVQVAASSFQSARALALHEAFRRFGWRKTSAPAVSE